jgi:hypothetical protein
MAAAPVQAATTSRESCAGRVLPGPGPMLIGCTMASSEQAPRRPPSGRFHSDAPPRCRALRPGTCARSHELHRPSPRLTHDPCNG